MCPEPVVELHHTAGLQHGSEHAMSTKHVGVSDKLEASLRYWWVIVYTVESTVELSPPAHRA